MGKKDIERAKKKLLRIQKVIDEFTERTNKELKDLMDLLELESKSETTQKRTRRLTPRRSAQSKDNLDEEDD